MASKKEVEQLCSKIRELFPDVELRAYRVSNCGIVSDQEDQGCFCKEQWLEMLPKASYEAVVLPLPEVFYGVNETVKISTMFPYWRAALLKNGEGGMNIMETNSLTAFAKTMAVLGKEEDPLMAVMRAVRLVEQAGGLRIFGDLFGVIEKAPVGGVIN